MCLGIPGKIVSITDEHTAMVDVSGIQRAVNIACVVDSQQNLGDLIDEWVLVHVGFAMSKIDEQEAQATLALLQELGELQSEIDSMAESVATGATHE